MKSVMAVVLAGGRGSRLMPLTSDRAKPAVPFGGKYTIFDFVMNSIINSEIRKTIVLTQYGSQPLSDHIDKFGFSNLSYGTSVKLVPAQMRIGNEWYRGTADAVFQNLEFIEREKKINKAAILAGDHIYNIDLRQMCDFHKEKQSKFTVCALVMETSKAAGNFGVIEVDENFKIIGFEEKPEEPREIPKKSGFCFVSMGNYLVDVDYLSEILNEDTQDSSSEHDFGRNIIPKMIIAKAPVFAYDFSTNKIPGQEGSYWRDVGRISEFYEAHMDLVSNNPTFNLYNNEWPIRTFPDHLPPAKTVRNYLNIEDALAPDKDEYMYENIMASGGCIFDAPLAIKMSSFGRRVYVDFGASIIKSIVLSGVRIGANTKIIKTIIDEDVFIPEGESVGYNNEKDRAKGLVIKDGITIVPKGFIF